MNDDVWQALCCALSKRQAALAGAWTQALPVTESICITTGDAHCALAPLSDSALAALCTEKFDPVVSHTIGAALAHLSPDPTFMRAALGALVQVITTGLDHTQVLALLPRLTDVQHAVAEGFAHTVRQRAHDTYLRAVIDALPILLFALDHNGLFTLAAGKALETLALPPTI